MEETVAFTMEFNTPLGPIRGKVNVDIGPMRLVDLAPTAYELTNILVTHANRQEEKAGRKISCQSAFGACCCQMVPLSAPEAFYLADLMDSLEDDRREDLFGRFETREYNVTSPASWCTDPYKHEIAKVLMPLPLSAPLARLAAKLTYSKPQLIPLTLAPRWVVEHFDLRKRQWPGLELFKGFIAEIGPEK